MRRALVIVALGLAACQPRSGASSQSAVFGAHQLTDLVGTWRWAHRTTEGGTTRIETEQWQFRPSSDPRTRYLGRYIRDVEVRSEDRVPFTCNGRLTYRQRAVYDVEVTRTREGFALRETDYRAEPSPCDHGFRHVSAYNAVIVGNQLRLAWAGGTQTLFQTDSVLAELPADPWPGQPSLAGPWRWETTSFDDEGHVRDEAEWWEITPRGETRLDITYRRRVTVRNPDGAPIACANAASWTFDDAYVLEGQREEEHWHFYERASEPGDHPCLRVTPRRALDEATAEQLGDHVVLEWRGKRRQVLYRPR